MQKIRTNDLFSSEFDLLLQPRISNPFLLQNQNTSTTTTTTTITNMKVGEQKEKIDIQFDIHLDTILSNLNIIKNQIKF
ncbi:MAG TPA: hypothetical protein VJU85_07850 [Nitrososphaeraceae archaeon]|nr:hypothetical protein [Nitrososphaeraceae archaeon]